jgi:hypothetical protein
MRLALYPKNAGVDRGYLGWQHAAGDLFYCEMSICALR